MKKEDFYGTFWDVSKWTEKQKIQWQEKCFEIGFSWDFSHRKVCYLNAEAYFLSNTSGMSYSNDYYRDRDYRIEKQFSDMFPEEVQEQPKKLDIISEIVQLVQESQVTEEEEEEEETFEGLVYVSPEEDYAYLILNKLSEDQKLFIQQNLPCDEVVVHTTYPKLSLSGEVWYTGFGFSESATEVSFNDIFRYKEI